MPVLFIALPRLCAHNRRQGGLFVFVSRKGPLLQEPRHKLLFFTQPSVLTISPRHCVQTCLALFDGCVVFLVMAPELHVLGHRCRGGAHWLCFHCSTLVRLWPLESFWGRGSGVGSPSYGTLAGPLPHRGTNMLPPAGPSSGFPRSPPLGITAL